MTDGTEASPGATRRPSRLPRPETALLTIGLVLTIAAKLGGLQQYADDHLLTAWMAVIAPDCAFFLAVATVLRGMHAIGPTRLVSRLAVVVGALVLGWAVLNAGWLYVTGVQLQPGVIGVIAGDLDEFLPELGGFMRGRPLLMVAVALAGLIGLAWMIWRIVRPRTLARRPRLWTIAVNAALILIVALAGPRISVAPQLAYGRQVLAGSSHWLAILDVAGLLGRSGDLAPRQRSMPRAGERTVTPPPEGAPRPNIVILMLESVSHLSSGIGDPQRTPMPHLEALAAQGVEFTKTRAPMPLTSKAFWAILSGTMPDMSSADIESVLADEPFESLATILGRDGYRSGFFQMSKGTFRCTPAVFANLDFDWAWFRENLGDPSAHLGYLAGDDHRMIDPAFDWATQSDEPFLLAMITSVSHDPYEVPAWWGDQVDGRHEAYLQSVRYTDDVVEAVHQAIVERGLRENTIYCVIGDHGEGFRGGSAIGRWSPLEELIRVPWVIHWPGHIAPAQVTGPCSQLDVTPTLLSLAGYDIAAASFDGLNALGGVPDDRRIYFASCFRGSPIGFVEGSRKIVCLPQQGSVMEFDLTRDPSEESPRVIDSPAGDELADLLESWQAGTSLAVEMTRFRERVLYDHWNCFSSGHSSWTIFQPNPGQSE